MKSDLEKYKVPSLEKALDVIEYLSEASAPMPLSTIAQDIDRTASELFRVLDCLVKRNYVIKDRTVNAYSLSLKFFELTNSIPPIKRLIDASAAPLTLLLRDKGFFSCHLSLLEGGDIVIVYEQAGILPVHIHVKAGARISATHTSSGRVLLSCLTEPELDAALSLDSYYNDTAREEQLGIRKEIEGFRGSRVVLTESKQLPGIYDIVVPIKMHRTRFAALAVPINQFPVNREILEKLKGKVVSAAEDIRRAVGSL